MRSFILFCCIVCALVVGCAPEPTPTPTPTPESIPPPEIPEGWTTHELEEGRLAFAYPPQWAVSSNEPSKVRLKVSDDTFVAVEWVGERPMGLLPTELVNLMTVLEDTGKTLGWKEF